MPIEGTISFSHLYTRDDKKQGGGDTIEQQPREQ